MINKIPPLPQQQQNPTNQRAIPLSDLDFELMTINTEWGGQNVPHELKESLTENYTIKEQDDKGNITERQVQQPTWQSLGFYTRDQRLGNLDRMRGEVEFVRYYNDLANDFLQAQEGLSLQCSFKKPFLICLSRGANILETSQSVNGFMRRRLNTMTHESFQQNTEPPKKTFFGTERQQQ